MSAFFDELGGLTGGVGSEALAFAVGFAAGRALEPAGVTIAQDAWNAAPVRRLDPGAAAQSVAEGFMSKNGGAAEASYHGYDSSRFEALYNVALTAPGLGELLTMLRRGTINSGNFTHGLRKSKLEPMWDDALAELATNYIGLGDIAAAIVRGAVPAPSWVPVAPPTSTTNVQRYPVVNIDPVALAKKLGFDEDMLRIMVARSGLSLAPGLAAQAFFRGIIADNDFHLAVAEGDLRTEWADALLAVSRQILTAGQYAELQLRGFLSADQRRTLTAQHGMAASDSDLLYNLLGRSINVHQILIGQRRGGTYNGDTSHIPAEYLAALERGNLRPEYYNLGYAGRETYPSYFVTRALAQAGVISSERAKELFEGLGWPLDVADAAAAFYAVPTAKAADTHVTKAATQLWTATHKSYIAQESGDSDAAERFDLLGIPADSQQAILKLWDSERSLIRKQLSPVEVRKAIGQPGKDVAWATAQLLDRGYNQEDATTFLNE